MLQQEITPLEFAKQQMEKSQKDLEQWTLIYNQLIGTSTVVRPPSSKKKSINAPDTTLAKRIVEVIRKHGSFMTGREIHTALRLSTEYSTFSSQLGIRSKKKDSKFKMFQYIDSKDNSKKFWYGLTDWFDEAGVIKDSYKQKIIKLAA